MDTFQSNSTIILGITGPIGSGKSSVGKILEGHGWTNLEVDQIGHQMLLIPRICAQLAEQFGDRILNDSGEIKRHELGRLAFSSPAMLEKLDAIMHPPLRAETRRIISSEKSRGTRGIALNAALLFKIGLDALCDKIVYVNADSGIRLERLVTIRGLPFDSAKGRLTFQDPRPNESPKILFCENNGSPEDLRNWVEAVLVSLVH
ncbi:MAG: dephospho-CoA kinase [Candidatus Riflebacteria bacterium]|nr:dephospho-CoA kinase [Candidatus Riflebacteria bacterium]